MQSNHLMSNWFEARTVSSIWAAIFEKDTNVWKNKQGKKKKRKI